MVDMKQLKPICCGLTIALAFFAFAYFIIDLEADTPNYWGAIGLMGFQSTLVGVAWGFSLYYDRFKKGEASEKSRY